MNEILNSIMRVKLDVWRKIVYKVYNVMHEDIIAC